MDWTIIKQRPRAELANISQSKPCESNLHIQGVSQISKCVVAYNYVCGNSVTAAFTRPLNVME